MDPAAQQLVHRSDSPHIQSPRCVVVPAACCRQDRCPLPHPSHRHFASELINSCLSGISLLLTSHLRTKSNGYWWISGRKLSHSTQPTSGRDVPCKYPECSLQDVEKKTTELTLILPLNMLSAVLWPKALDDQLNTITALWRSEITVILFCPVLLLINPNSFCKKDLRSYLLSQRCFYF